MKKHLHIKQNYKEKQASWLGKLSVVCILAFILLAFGSLRSVAADLLFNINGTKNSLPTLKLNEVVFVNYYSFFRLFASDLKYHPNSFTLHNGTVNVSSYANSFFILLENTQVDSAAEHIIQLTTPTYRDGINLYVPVNSAIAGLQNVFGFGCDIFEDKIYIELNAQTKDFFKKKVVEIAKKVVPVEETVGETEELNIPTHSVSAADKLRNAKLSSMNAAQVVDNDFAPEYKESVVRFQRYEFQQPSVIIKKELEDLENNVVLANEKVEEEAQTEIIKPDISSLDFDREMEELVPDVAPQEPVKPVLPKTETILQPAETELHSTETPLPVNKNSLPPFRKYSIPDTLVKKRLNELK